MQLSALSKLIVSGRRHVFSLGVLSAINWQREFEDEKIDRFLFMAVGHRPQNKQDSNPKCS
jgi:hypothetical protein